MSSNATVAMSASLYHLELGIINQLISSEVIAYGIWVQIIRSLPTNTFLVSKYRHHSMRKSKQHVPRPLEDNPRPKPHNAGL